MGIYWLHFLELNNLQRQVLYDEEDVAAGVPKAIAAEAKLRRINSQVEIEAIVADVDYTNIDFIEGIQGRGYRLPQYPSRMSSEMIVVLKSS